jgi:hypothetical protein
VGITISTNLDFACDDLLLPRRLHVKEVVNLARRFDRCFYILDTTHHRTRAHDMTGSADRQARSRSLAIACASGTSSTYNHGVRFVRGICTLRGGATSIANPCDDIHATALWSDTGERARSASRSPSCDITSDNVQAATYPCGASPPHVRGTSSVLRSILRGPCLSSSRREGHLPLIDDCIVNMQSTRDNTDSHAFQERVLKTALRPLCLQPRTGGSPGTAMDRTSRRGGLLEPSYSPNRTPFAGDRGPVIGVRGRLGPC